MRNRAEMAMEPKGAAGGWLARWFGSNPREMVLTLIGVSIGLLCVLTTMENKSRGGRIVFTLLTVVLAGWSLWQGWLDVRHLRRVLLPVGALLVAICISIGFSIDPSFSFKAFWTQHLQYIFFFLLIGAWAVTEERKRTLLWWLAGAGIYSAVLGIFFFHTAEALHEQGWLKKPHNYVYVALDNDGNVYRRAQGILNSYTRSAMVFIVALPAATALLVWTLRNGRRREAVLLTAGIVISVWYMLLTKSRGAWIAATLACVLVCIFLRVRWLVVAGGVALVVLIVAVTPEARWRALMMTSQWSDWDTLLSGRLDLWQQGFQPIAENPLTGLGYGGDIFQTDAARDRYPIESAGTEQPDLHQLYMQTQAEVGILGSLAYLWLLTVVISGALMRFRENWRAGVVGAESAALAALAAFLSIGIVYYWNEERVGLLAWMIFGLIVAGGAAARDDPAVNRGTTLNQPDRSSPV